MAQAPNTDNYSLGKGVVFFDQLLDGTYRGERDLGNAPSFTISTDIETLEHYSSRGGLKAKDKEVISEITPGCTFSLDEINKENMELLTMGTTTSETQTGGSASSEVVTAPTQLGNRVELDKRGIISWVLPYNETAADNVLFVAGETVTGAGGATGIVLGLSVGATAASGTLYIARTNTTDFVDAEVITGGTAGLAEVNSATGGTQNSSTPVILVQDSTDTTTYVADTDYEIDTSLSDDNTGRIRIIETGSITSGETLHVTYQYDDLSWTQISAFALTQVIGKLRFVSDNPAGINQELIIHSTSLVPSGDTAFIGDDWSTITFTGEILKDETNNPLSPYMDIILGQEAT